MKILVIEDNEELANSICNYFSTTGCICASAFTLNDAKDKLSLYSYDCMILDIMLPDGNGLSLLEFLTAEEVQKTGILILSANDSTDHKIRGLEQGADDYLTKPFHLPELHARVKAIYRRRNLQGSNNQLITCRAITANTQSKQAFINNQSLELTQKEFELLLYFIINKNRVLSRQAIANHLWGDHTDHLSNIDFVYQHIKNLRKKISRFTREEYIQTVYSLGYRLNNHNEP